MDKGAAMTRDHAASVRARLLNVAKATGTDFNLVLVRFALERLLFRLSASAHADRFVLKGALLFTLWYDLPHRATRDADLLGFGPSDPGSMAGVFRDIASVVAADGIVFEPASVRVGDIRKDAGYGGVRVTLNGKLANARCVAQVDVGFGDAVTPGPTDAVYPVLLDDLPAPRLRTYPVDTTRVVRQLFGRYRTTGEAIPVSFRELVPWMKVGERATHYLHSYPAKLLPHIAHFFLASKSMCPEDGLVLDPFSGSGTVALEACLSGRPAAIADTNPLARLITAAKHSVIPATSLQSGFERVEGRYLRTRTRKHPAVVNIERWFQPRVIHALARLKASIDEERPTAFKLLLLATFSAVVRRVSNADPRLSVPVALKGDVEQLTCGDVWKKFCDQFWANARRMGELDRIRPGELRLSLAGNDARCLHVNSGGQPVAANDLFIVGDAHQRIYRHKVVLSRVGIEVRGRSRSLKVNYRTTDEIRRWACAQVEGCAIDDLDGNIDTLRGYRSLTHGDRPDVVESPSLQDDIKHIKAILKQLADDSIEPRQVCIAARTNDDVDSIVDGLKKAGVATLRLERSTPDDPALPGVRVATMHRIKGLEFGVVIIAAYKGATKYAELFARDEDAGVSDETETAERSLLHVAATRAKRHLFVLSRPAP